VTECRNCGGTNLENLGPIGRLAPFFLKRVLGLEIRSDRSKGLLKQRIRNLAAIPMSLLSRASSSHTFAEMQICKDCEFIQTRNPFRDDDIMRLYRDYRSDSYNRERIQYEPSYSSIAAQVGQDQTEISNRVRSLNAFLHRNLGSRQPATILDYGGADGKFLPDYPGSKSVYEVSEIQPVAGVTRIHDESKLGLYSLVLLSHVIEHATHPVDLVRKVASYVEPDGYLYLETPQEIDDRDRVALREGSVQFDIGIHEHINSYCIPAVSALLKSSGLSVVAIESGLVNVGWAKAVHIRALGQKKPV
jgi:hypothetical protein